MVTILCLRLGRTIPAGGPSPYEHSCLSACNVRKLKAGKVEARSVES